MSLVIVRPTAQHAAANVLSATQQAGLTVQEPAPAAANAGALRLRCSGVPTAVVDVSVTLSSGGAPTGYTVPGAIGADGAAAKWIRTGEAAALKRGYLDSTVLSHVMMPITYNANNGTPSTPRTLPDGYLGVIVPNNSTLSVVFYRISTTGTSSGVTLTTAMGFTAARCDFVILPSGRLVAIIPVNDSVGGLKTHYSDDYGVTWSLLSSRAGGNAFLYVLCAEAVGDEILLVRAAVGGGTGYVFLSRDGGSTFGSSVTSATMDDPRTATLGGTVYMIDRAAVSLQLRPVLPGGIFGTPVATGVGAQDAGCVVARDDGVLVAFAWQSAAVGTLDTAMAFSVNGGLTWAAATTATPLTLSTTGYAANGYKDLAGCMWNGRMVFVARVDSSLGSDNSIHLLMFGEWSNIDCPALPYGFLPVDYPENVGWTRTNSGVGATVTNQNALSIVSTVADSTSYAAPVAFWAAATTRGVIRFGLRVNSGGSLPDRYIRTRVIVTDGADRQGLLLSFTTTAVRATDLNNVQVGADLAVAMNSVPVEFIQAIRFDGAGAGLGVVSVWYRATGSETWTLWIDGLSVGELAGVGVAQFQFGNIVGGATNAEWTHINAEDTTDNGLSAGSTLAAATLAGRPLTSGYDYQLTTGVNLGAYGTGGVPSDTYALKTRYTYGADNVWAELRPSRRAQSTDDSAAWGIVFDAGATDLFHGDVIAVFATNMRQAEWQLNSSDSWGTPAVTVTLDATLVTFLVTTAGRGYITGPSGTTWRSGQFRSSGDSRRFFVTLTVGTSQTYEITDNDETRLYIADVDLTTASGTVHIFGDRMGARLAQFAQYRFARFYVASALPTADNVYRVGTPVFDKAWTPAQLYDFGFVERIEPNTVTTDADSGASLTYRRGPALDVLSIQWPPLDRLRVDVEERLRDLYRSIDGNLTPVVLWRDTGDVQTLSLVQVREVYQATNVRGELGTALTRVDQLVLREVW
jgi:hypothetical protein